MNIQQTDKTPDPQKRKAIYLSPFIIIGVNCIVAVLFGKIIGKWAFIPIIIIEWGLFIYFISKFGEANQIKRWLSKPRGSIFWLILSVFIGLTTLPIFLKHFELLNTWKIILPWLIIALLNPFLEEFYWRGLLLDYTKQWKNWAGIILTSLLFSANHYVFAINADLFKGFPVFISTLVMGIVWAIVYKKTRSLKWTRFSHFLVDFLNLSAASFLDLYKPGW